MRIIKILSDYKNGIEVVKPKYFVTRDIDLSGKDNQREKALYEELTKLLNL